MIRVTHAKYLGELCIRLVFSAGAAGTVDFRGKLNGTIFQPLNDPAVFCGFELTDHTLQWPNGADFAPEYLHEAVVHPNSMIATTQREDG